ncbi:hypothetical protein MMC28_008248 [Mycoblastus sanguinarius]|nr:hypothetical protein [Mycoblastus sanguinarius]
MPVSYRTIQKYGSSSDATVTIPLLWSLEKSDPLHDTCKVILSVISPAQPWDQGVDWSVWAVAVAIDAMCWRRGKSGTAIGLGVNGRLKLTFDQTYGSSLGETSIGNLTGS